MNASNIRDNLKDLEYDNRFVLCIYDGSHIINDFVQVVLKAVSDEPDYVCQQRYSFDANSLDGYYYVKADMFTENICHNYNCNYDYLSLEEQAKELDDYLPGKLILVNPYYYYNENRDIFFKNGTVVDVLEDLYEGDFICIPKIPNQKTFDSLLECKEIPLPDVSRRLLGVPRYLYFDSAIYAVSNLKASDVNDTYWKIDKIEDIGKCKINYEDGVKEGSIIPTDKYDINFLYVDQSAILEAEKANKSEETVPVIQQAPKPEANKFEDSEIGKILQKFYNFTKSNNLCYSKDDIFNFYTCACSSQLIILAGMSGTGKTKLALKFAEYFNMTEDNNKLLFVPVSPSFNEPADVLGYLNPTTGIYSSSETRLVEFLKHAEEHENEMHMVVFDEMNLAQIEFWFAPFISILEKDLGDRKLHLYSKSQVCKNKDQYPDTIEIKNNIIFVGTINIDETTKNISDRLLDRSFIINLKKETFANYKSQQSANLGNEIQVYDNDFMSLMPAKDDLQKDYISDYSLDELEFFDAVNDELNAIDPQKGISFRCVKNIALYLRYRPEEMEKNKAFDFAFKQTVMKKINGTIESIGEFIGDTLDENGNSNGRLTELFNAYSNISDFSECRNEVRNKVLELKKYGYAR